MPEQDLGDVIREAQVAGGQSLRDLANRLEISPSQLSEIENDRRAPLTPLPRTAPETWPAVHPDGNALFCHPGEVVPSRRRGRTAGHQNGEGGPPRPGGGWRR